MQVRPHNGVSFVSYETLLPFLAANPTRIRLTTTTQPTWFEAAWQRTFPDFEAYVFEGREEVPPALTLVPKDSSIRGRVVLQYAFVAGRPEYTVIVTREGRTLWLEQHIVQHDVETQLRKALEMVREPVATRPEHTSHRTYEPRPSTAPPIDSTRPVPLAQTAVPAWWDVHWTGYEFTDMFLPGLLRSALRPPTISLEFNADSRFEIQVRDYSQSPWRETWTVPDRPIQVLVLVKGKPILEQRLPKDKLRIRPAVSLAVRKLHEEYATISQQEHKPQDVNALPPDFDLRRPHQMGPTAPVVPPEEVDLAPAVPLTQPGLFGPFVSLLDKADPADDAELGRTGAQFTYIAPSTDRLAGGVGPPVAMFRRTERTADPTAVAPSKEDRILVTWFGDRWKRKRFPKQPYNLKVYFANRLLAESDVASVAEAWRLVQKANTDLAAKRRRVEVADLKFKPLKLTLNQHLIELDPATIAKIVAVIATGSTYMFKWRGKELYGVRKGKKPKVISVPYGDTKPVYLKALDAWIRLIKAEG